MEVLRIRLFGCPGVSLNGEPWARQATRNSERLLGFLALNGERTHPREKLATLLWKDVSLATARNALNTTVWRLRKSLEPNKADRGRFLKVDGAREIGLNFSDELWCDAHAFVTALDASEDTQLHDSVVALEGELLEGFYDDWIVAERERLNAARAQALQRLMSVATDSGSFDRALDYGRRVLERDPLRESVHRSMIWLYLQLGQRTQALRQYEACVAAIHRELGIQPMPETQALIAEIRNNAS